MKWIGQHIYDLASRFRNDVFLEDISTGTIASGAHLGLDSNNKIVKAVDGGGDITGVALTAGTGVDLTSVSGATGGAYAATIGVDVSDFMSNGAVTNVLTAAGADAMQSEQYFTFRNSSNISTLALLSNEDTGDTFNIQTTTHGATTLSTTDDDATAAHIKIAADGDILLEPATGDLTMYDAVNDGNPTISLGSSATNRFEIKTTYNSGAQTLDEVYFNSYTTSTTTNDGRFIFQVDEVELARFIDTGFIVSGSCRVNGDSITNKNTTASSATEGGKLKLSCDDGAAMGDDHRLGVIEFEGAEDASNTRVVGASIQAMCDAAWSASENGTRLEFYTMDGNAASELSLTLDSNKLATFAGGVTVTGTITGDVTGNVTGDVTGNVEGDVTGNVEGNLTGRADTVSTIAGLAPNTATTQATQAAITTCANLVSIGTITTGVWNGTAIATDQQKHLANFEFEGFSVGDGTNYMIAELNSDTKAPFEHQTSTGSDGLTATGPVRLLKTAGHVMPYAGKLKLWKGWATSSGSTQTVDVGLYKVTLVNNDSDDISPAVLINTSFTSVGNSTPLTFAETPSSTFAAGDILISAIRNGTNNKRCDFSSTLVVEWN